MKWVWEKKGFIYFSWDCKIGAAASFLVILCEMGKVASFEILYLLVPFYKKGNFLREANLFVLGHIPPSRTLVQEHGTTKSIFRLQNYKQDWVLQHFYSIGPSCNWTRIGHVPKKCNFFRIFPWAEVIRFLCPQFFFLLLGAPIGSSLWRTLTNAPFIL